MEGSSSSTSSSSADSVVVSTEDLSFILSLAHKSSPDLEMIKRVISMPPHLRVIVSGICEQHLRTATVPPVTQALFNTPFQPTVPTYATVASVTPTSSPPPPPPPAQKSKSSEPQWGEESVINFCSKPGCKCEYIYRNPRDPVFLDRDAQAIMPDRLFITGWNWNKTEKQVKTTLTAVLKELGIQVRTMRISQQGTFGWLGFNNHTEAVKALFKLRTKQWLIVNFNRGAVREDEVQSDQEREEE